MTVPATNVEFGAGSPGIDSWYWDVEDDLLWTGPALVSTEVDRTGPWHGTRSADNARPMSEWLDETLCGQQHLVGDFLDVVRRSERGDVHRVEVRVSESRWLALRATVAQAQGGKATAVFGFVHDITRYRLAEHELQFHEAFMERVGNGEPLGVILEHLCLELESRLPGARLAVLVQDRATAQLWHAAAPSLSAVYTAAIDGIPVADDSLVSGTAAHRGENVVIHDVYAELTERVQLLTDEGTRSVWAHPLISSTGGALGTITVHRAVPGAPSDHEVELVTRHGRLATLAIERAMLNPELLRATSIDHHTGLPNRARFLEIVNRWLDESIDEMAVLVIDIEGYHQLSAERHRLDIDAILRDVADRFAEVVEGDGIIAGLDAERFGVAVVLPSRNEVLQVARRILRTFDEPVSITGAAFYLAACIGVAYGHDADAHTLLSEAVVAAHAARAEGLGAIRVYDEAMRSGMQQRLEREADLRRAIEAEEFVLYYQPSYSVAGRNFDRAEALVRWNHPIRGLVPPDDFIPLAEQTGLIVPLGAVILRQAVMQAKQWHERFPDLHLSVNVSAAQLANPTFADEVAALIEEIGAPIEVIALEVTESGLMENLDVARATLDRFVELGVHVLVDDFGTGHSSLARLDEIPVHALKIDKRFIQRLTSDPITPTVVRAVIDVARAHGLRVTAEGVEDAETLAMVEDLGCHYVQGYHFCRPVPPADFEQFLERHASLGD